MRQECKASLYTDEGSFTPSSRLVLSAAVLAGCHVKAQCASCHTGASFTDAPALHAPAETGMDTNEARRSATGKYRTTPLRGAWQHPPYFHDGSAATLADVVVHYDGVLGLQLTPPERADLEQYLRSL